MRATKLTELHLLTLFLGCFVIGAFLLFWQNERSLDPLRSGSWWTLGFEQPTHANDLAIVIENYTADPKFHYVVMEGKTILKEGDFTVQSGTASHVDPGVQTNGAKTSLVVTHGSEKKEIYR